MCVSEYVASICMAVEQRDVVELHNARFERLIATQCCRLAAALFLSLTLCTHTDKIGARDEYIISLQMFVHRTFSLAKSIFRLDLSTFRRLFIQFYWLSQLRFPFSQSGKKISSTCTRHSFFNETFVSCYSLQLNIHFGNVFGQKKKNWLLKGIGLDIYIAQLLKVEDKWKYIVART